MSPILILVILSDFSTILFRGPQFSAMALKLELYTRVAGHVQGRPIRVFRAKSWKSMRKRMARFLRDHKKSTVVVLHGDLTWREGNQKGFCEAWDFH